MVKDLAINRTPGNNSGLRIWSAGCSNGSEPYTLSIILEELAPGRNHYLLATDLDRTILTKARARGPYTADDTRNVSLDHRKKYFDDVNSQFFIKENIAKRVTFKEQNMLTEPF